jgi:hypothetical protein
MLRYRAGVAVFSLLVLVLTGLVMATVASAEAGPFWYHREVGGSKSKS